MKALLQKTPFLVPANNGLVIEEYFGRTGIADERLSLAGLIAPPHWVEPHQTPEFDEYTLVFSGRKQIEVDGKNYILGPGESLLVYKGSRIQYSNPFNEPVAYCEVCIPRFSIEAVHKGIEDGQAYH